MEGARFLALLYFEGRVEGRGAIAPLKRDALLLSRGLFGLKETYYQDSMPYSSMTNLWKGIFYICPLSLCTFVSCTKVFFNVNNIKLAALLSYQYLKFFSLLQTIILNLPHSSGGTSGRRLRHQVRGHGKPYRWACRWVRGWPYQQPWQHQWRLGWCSEPQSYHHAMPAYNHSSNTLTHWSLTATQQKLFQVFTSTTSECKTFSYYILVNSYM